MDSTFFDQLADQHYAVADQYFSQSIYRGIQNYLDELISENSLRRAGIGTLSNFEVNQAVRGDRIFWIRNDETYPAIVDFLQSMEELRHFLNRTFFLSLSDGEFHFAHYPPGSFYRRHVDQFKGRNNRQITVLLYLNDQWKNGDGGELKIFTKYGEQLIEPIGNRFVVFKSDSIEHEVMKTHVHRKSLTGWLLSNPVGLGFLG